MVLIRVEDLSRENVDDVFYVCSWNRDYAPMDDPVAVQGWELKRQWYHDMLDKHGSCTKIAYLNGRPVAQLLYYPEVLIPFLHNPRPGVVYLKCIYNRYNDARRKGVGAALMRSLIDDCRNGLDTLNGEGCSFISTILLHEDDPALDDFYSKYGFKNGEGELYLEINGSYTPMEVPELAPLPEDKDRAIFTYSPDCEWGYYVSTVGKQMIQEKYPEYPVDVYDIWNEPEQYKKRGGGWMLIIGGLLINGVIPEAPPLFWYDRERWFQNVEKAMGLV